MPHPVFHLCELSESIAQGLSVSRYKAKEGMESMPKFVVNVKDLDNLYINHALEEIQLGSKDNFKRYTLNKDDVIIAIRGSLLKSAVITKASEGSIAGTNVAVLRLKRNKVNPAYIAVLLRSKWMERSIYKLQLRSSTTLPSIRVSDVREITIPLPDMNTQNDIVKLYTLIETYKKLTDDELTAKQELIESVLINLF